MRVAVLPNENEIKSNMIVIVRTIARAPKIVGTYLIPSGYLFFKKDTSESLILKVKIESFISEGNFASLDYVCQSDD